MMLACLVAMALAADGGLKADVGKSIDQRAAMRDAFSALVRLQEVAAKPGVLRDAKAAASISSDLGRLKSLEHAFPADAQAQEPATAALSSLLGRYAAETQRRFDAHELESVAPRVRTLMSLCVTCHARERSTGDFADAFKRIDKLELTGLDRALVLVSTRQFDAALVEYGKLLDTPGVEFAVWARALQDSLTLLVRVKDDPVATGVLLDKVSARPGLPRYVAAILPGWKKDLADWRAEKFDARLATPEMLFKKAQALVLKANGGAVYADERKDVLWLRASGYLNLALAKNPKLKSRGEALYLLGACAEGLRSPSWWDVDELFYEACVRENPKTPLARRCFERLSARVTLGFTGSAGTFIPDDELVRLEELKALTGPLKP